MRIVVDASVVISWALSDENHPTSALALKKIKVGEAVVPALLWFEVRNVLIINERRRRLDGTTTRKILRDLARLRINVDRTPDEDEVMRLARTHRLTVYDAAYLELAQREGAHLATLDSQLAKAALAERVPILGSGAAS